jgi:hypothetical protein
MGMRAIVVQVREPGASFDGRRIGLFAEEADVVRDGPSEQHVVLHHRAELAADVRDAQAPHGHAAVKHLAFRRVEQAEQDLQQRRLARSGWTRDGHVLPGLDA